MVRLPGIMRPCTPAAAALNFKKGSSVQDFRVKTFLTVCKTLNYTRAAEELALTQPAVSQHITYLEREYNAKLFTYHRKKLSSPERAVCCATPLPPWPTTTRCSTSASPKWPTAQPSSCASA